MDFLIPVLSGVCCLSGSMVVVVGAIIVMRRNKGGSGNASADTSSSQALDVSSSSVPASPFPASASADLSSGGAPQLGAPAAPSADLGGGSEEVEDFDEDGPTTLVDTTSRRPSPTGAEPGFSGGPATRTQAPTERGSPQPRRPPASTTAPTERIRVPSPSEPLDPSEVYAPDEPPPLPRTHAAAEAPPSSRRLHLDPSFMPDTSTLQPGATIIPPDDWNDDYIEDDEADETMLMARPPLPPKK